MNRKIIIKLNIQILSHLCLYLFFAMTAVIFLYEFNSTMFNLRYGFMAIGALCGYYFCFRSHYRMYGLPLLSVVLLLCWTLCFVYEPEYQNYTFGNVAYTLIYIGLSTILLQNKYSHKMTLILYAFTSLTIIVKLIQNVNVNHIMLATSRNYISVLLLLPMMFYYISCHDKNKPFSVFPVISFFFIGIFSLGRGGVASAGYLTVALCIYKVMHINNKRQKLIIWMIIVLTTMLAIIYISGLDSLVFGQFLNANFSRFVQKGVTDEARLYYWSSFLENNKQSFLTFLFGSDVHLIRSDGNLHNSFLQSYAAFGIVGFLIIIGLSIRSMFMSIRKKDYLYLILFIGLAIRAFTDVIFFQGYCEIFLYYFLFYWDFKKKTNTLERSDELRSQPLLTN